MIRCVNIDWLEVYVLESRDRYPCNAEYFRRCGYFVKERDYGTRQYNEMFTIEDKNGNPWIEVRRNPASGEASFSGVVPESSHIRLCNRTCYLADAVTQLRDFLIRHNYIFQRIFRIDICYDFEKFDSGDSPAKFCRRYLARKYSKINQCKVSPHGEDNWSDFDWETISWGSRKSMVTTKIYNKTKELASSDMSKPYIVYTWFLAGLIDDPVNLTRVDKDGKVYKPDIWRIEFSLRSKARHWLVIESQEGKRVKKKAIPHNLSMFDSPDKLWQRFEDLAFHYFRFKKFKEGVRKDRCEDKVLFRFAEGREFLQVKELPPASKPEHTDVVLKRRLIHYRETHLDNKVRQACDCLISSLDRNEAYRLVTQPNPLDIEVLQRSIAVKMKYPEKDVVQLMAEIRDLLINDKIF